MLPFHLLSVPRSTFLRDLPRKFCRTLVILVKSHFLIRMLQSDMFLEIPVQLGTMRTVGTLELWLLATLQFHVIIKGLLPTIAFPTSFTYKSLIWKLTLCNIMSSIRCGLQQTKYLSEIWWLLQLSMLTQPSAFLCMLNQPRALQCFFKWFKNIYFPNI